MRRKADALPTETAVLGAAWPVRYPFPLIIAAFATESLPIATFPPEACAPCPKATLAASAAWALNPTAVDPFPFACA